jgi:hypothetical protein
MNSQQADIVSRLLELAIDNAPRGWERLRTAALEAGYKADEIVDALAALAELAGVDPLATNEDF